MARLTPASVFVKDPIDVWGREVGIGLSELAVRNHSVPKMFDRRGNVAYWDDFESPTLKYTNYTSGAASSVARSTDFAYMGDYSVKAITDATLGDYAGVLYRLSDLHLGKIGSEFKFSTADDDYLIRLLMTYHDGTNENSAILRWTESTGNLDYLKPDSSYGSIATGIERYQANGNWGTVKLVIDTDANKYVRALFFGNEYDLSEYTLFTGASAYKPHVEILFRLETAENVAKTGYIDSFILTDDEVAA